MACGKGSLADLPRQAFLYRFAQVVNEFLAINTLMPCTNFSEERESQERTTPSLAMVQPLQNPTVYFCVQGNECNKHKSRTIVRALRLS